MFRKRDETASPNLPKPAERVTSVLASGISWRGSLGGTGGVRIEGAYEGNINLRGMLVVAESGRVNSEHLRANVVIIAGNVRANITTERLEIRSTGRVWGDVVTAAFSTEEGAFLRGQIRMEESVDIGVAPESDTLTEEQVPGEGGDPEAESTAEMDSPDKGESPEDDSSIEEETEAD
ncbi:MAG: polymer-forming cytoskeletal protein [Anaerolineales bacterium]|jgi:cytoskeletal protein CcmA (bactofilin family)